MVSPIFRSEKWKSVEIEGMTFEDITYHRAVDQGTV
ncbi:MAG: 1,4-dihydroxy-2-naphthoyl-CoA synthase, partial [Proteobacteria bacterium]